jgi:hypothetical protein
MSEYQTQSITREQLMVMSVNLLHRAFIEAPRTEAKKLYRQIADGDTVALTQVRMDDGGILHFDLALDHSEYDGSLNYSAFRASMATVLQNLANALQKKQDINTFSADNNPNRMIFGITGVTADKDVPAVMVVSADVRSAEGRVVLRPMYLDYQQFLRSEGAGDA